MTTANQPLDRLSWFRWVTAGEFVGFVLPAVAGAVAPWPAVLVLAGVVEGAVLGWAQARVLPRVLPGLPGLQWIATTAAAAGFAWTVAMMATANGERLASLPAVVLLPVAAVLGMAVLLSIGTAQWLVLRYHVQNAHRWVWATGVAWGMALLVFLVVTIPLWQPGLALRVLIGVLGGLLMAATMALITGTALARLVEER
ncbi:hypothetical protein [Umezawaea sp.]|uniref:hypothetical protein n=1 Tax=Umezawaea sp. TaxID=1955258 RepID=UPI002ED02CCC